MGITPTFPTVVGGGSPTPAVSGKPEILHYRAGALLSDYAVGQTTPTNFGVALRNAFGAMVDGDELDVANVYASVTDQLPPPNTGTPNWAFDRNGCRLRFRNSKLVSSGSNYVSLFRINGHENQFDGLCVDGLTLSNTGNNGEGILVVGNQNRLLQVESHRLRGSGVAAGMTITGHDTVVRGFRSLNPYYGLRIAGARRTTVDDVYIEDPLNRAVNIEGSGLMEFVKLSNFTGRYYKPIGEAGVFTNCNIDGLLERLEIDNYDMYNGDVHGDGFSYDYPAALQLFKCHGVRRGYFNRMRLWHGHNKDTVNGGAGPSFRVPGIQEGISPEELHFTDCVFAGHLKLPTDEMNVKVVRLRRCHFGARSTIGSQPLRDITADNLDAEDCTFSTVSTVANLTSTVLSAEPRKSTSRLRLVRSRFIFNTSSSCYVVAGEVGMASITRAIGFNEVHSNEYINYGTGFLAPANGATPRLVVTTDENGDLLYDGHLAEGIGAHQRPAAGTAPNWFAGTVTPPVKANVKIWNTAYSDSAPLAINQNRGWMSAVTAPLTATFATDDTITATAHGYALNDVVFFTLGGMNTRFTATFATNDVITAPGHTFVNGSIIEFRGGPDVVWPATGVKDQPGYWRIVPARSYYVRDVSGDTFKIALTSGGAAIDISTASSGLIQARLRELPAALFPEQQYFVRDVTANTFKVAATFNGAAIDLTDVGSTAGGGSRRVQRTRWELMT